jgi:predicted component of type VI protein secretion system
VKNGETKPDDAVERLRAQRGASGLPISDAGADFAFAAIDIGHRLLARQKPEEAEPFFQAAEQALAQAVSRTADTAAQEKAQYLQKLALIRGNYLNKAVQASQDIEAAIKLQPEDEQLLRLKSTLSRRQPAAFRDKANTEGAQP